MGAQLLLFDEDTGREHEPASDDVIDNFLADLFEAIEDIENQHRESED